MKNYKLVLITSILMLLTEVQINAQDTTKKTIEITKTWISLNNSPDKIKGVLYDLKDSSILVSNSYKVQDYYSDKIETVELHIKNIETIKVRKKNNILIGAGIGAIVGLTATAIVVSGNRNKRSSLLWDKNSFKELDAALIVGVGLGAAGIGALIGSIKIKIPINGSMNNYKENHDKLRKKAVM